MFISQAFKEPDSSSKDGNLQQEQHRKHRNNIYKSNEYRVKPTTSSINEQHGSYNNVNKDPE